MHGHEHLSLHVEPNSWNGPCHPTIDWLPERHGYDTRGEGHTPCLEAQNPTSYKALMRHSSWKTVSRRAAEESYRVLGCNLSSPHSSTAASACLGVLTAARAAQVTGGRNGYGAKLANIFSTEFTIETCDGKSLYTQVSLRTFQGFMPRTRTVPSS